ncbi:MAG: alkaline phosphatase PhoX [Bacteroidota bacterium]
MMKRLFTLATLVLGVVALNAQAIFPSQIEAPEGFDSETLVMPQSPLSVQVLFIGGTDMVQTTATYGNEAGETPAKQWHDFIGFTPDNESDDLGWVSVNHEMIQANDMIGDGGGMTVFKVRRLADGSLEVVDQELEDGRKGKFFNVDFANTVGETGMNCGGIQGPDGRIWTAEEWFRRNNAAIATRRGEAGVRDTSDFTIDTKGEFPMFDGLTVEKYQNFNWMVEIDPKQAKAIRKQYNWGRQPFEGGSISANNRRVYFGPDATGAAVFGMFVADTPGDFTKGTMYAYDDTQEGYKWVPVFGGPETFLNYTAEAIAQGATVFNRIEWVVTDPVTGDIYFTETGNDDPGDNFAGSVELGGNVMAYHDRRAIAQGLTSATDTTNNFEYRDYFGRIMVYDVSEDQVRVYLEAGSAINSNKHMTNPDGLNIMMIDGKRYMVICEDLNGSSFGRVPAGTQSRTCELFLLDMDTDNPVVDDLIRIAVVPAGAEVTGAQPTADGKSLLVNSQHPSTENPFPYNNSLTFAINGFDKLGATDLNDEASVEMRSEAVNFDTTTEAEEELFSIYPNPTTRFLYLNKTTDVAIYDASGKRVLVARNTNEVNVSNLTQGIYFVQNADGQIKKLSIQ